MPFVRDNDAVEAEVEHDGPLRLARPESRESRFSRRREREAGAGPPRRVVVPSGLLAPGDDGVAPLPGPPDAARRRR